MVAKKVSILYLIIFLFLLIACRENAKTNEPAGSTPIQEMTIFYIDIENDSEYPVAFSYGTRFYSETNYEYTSAGIPPYSMAKAAITWARWQPMTELPEDYFSLPRSLYIKPLFFDAESNIIAAPIIAGWPEGMNDRPDIIHYGFGWVIGTNLKMYVLQDGITNEYPFSDRNAVLSSQLEWPYPDNIFETRILDDKPNSSDYFLFCDMKITITDTNDITVRVLDVYNTPR